MDLFVILLVGTIVAGMILAYFLCQASHVSSQQNTFKL